MWSSFAVAVSGPSYRKVIVYRRDFGFDPIVALPHHGGYQKQLLIGNNVNDWFLPSIPSPHPRLGNWHREAETFFWVMGEGGRTIATS
jgi:hypothetical protein